MSPAAAVETPRQDLTTFWRSPEMKCASWCLALAALKSGSNPAQSSFIFGCRHPLHPLLPVILRLHAPELCV